jgi:hypothetical protein
MPKVILEEVTLRAVEYLAASRDNKVFVDEEEMKVLLMASGSVCHFINNRQAGGSYVTEVTFSKMRFVTVTDNPIDFGPVVA